MVDAETLEDAKKKAKENLEDLGLPYKEKYMVFIKGTLREFKPSLENRLNSLGLEDDEMNKIFGDSNDIEIPNEKPMKDNIIRVNVKKDSDISIEGINVEKKDSGGIVKIVPYGVSFVDSLKVKQYIVTLKNKTKTYNNVEVYATSGVSALAYLVTSIERDEVAFDIYKDATDANIVEVGTNEEKHFGLPVLRRIDLDDD